MTGGAQLGSKLAHEFDPGHGLRSGSRRGACPLGSGDDCTLAGREGGVARILSRIARGHCHLDRPRSGAGAPTGAQQQEQREAAIQRWAQEAAADDQFAGTLGQETGRTTRAQGRDPVSGGRAGRHPRSLPEPLRKLRFGPAPGSGHRVQRPAGLRSPRAATAGGDRASRPRLSVWALR